MHRREFLRLSPAAATATVALTITEPGREPEPFDVRVLRLQPGDVVILTAPGSIRESNAALIKQYCEAVLPPGVRAWVFGDGLHVDGVLRGHPDGGKG